MTTNKPITTSNPPPLDESGDPTRPDKLTVDYYEQDGLLVLVKSGDDGPRGCLLLWLIGATFACGLLLFKVFTDPSVFISVFTLIFCAGWLAFAAGLVWMIFGKEMLLLGKDEAVFLRKAVIRLSSRVVPSKEIHCFREYRTVFRRRHGREIYYSGIEMLTDGKPLQFATELPERERAWLIHQLNQFLLTCKSENERPGLAQTMAIERGTSSNDESSLDGMTFPTEILTFERTYSEPPTDCCWYLSERHDGLAFTHKGRLDIDNLIGVFLLNAVWNGLVSLGVMALLGITPNNNGPQPQGWDWWGLFLVLIPFEAFGLLIFVLFVLVLLQPLRSTSWQFASDRIIERKLWLWFGHARTWNINELVRVELRQRKSTLWQYCRDVVAELSRTSSFDLTLVSSSNVGLCCIENLTEGEARWMAHFIFGRYSSWFGNAPR